MWVRRPNEGGGGDLAAPSRMDGLGSRGSDRGRWRPRRRVQVGGLPQLRGWRGSCGHRGCGGSLQFVRDPWGSFASVSICSDPCLRQPLAITVAVSRCLPVLVGQIWRVSEDPGEPLAGVAAFPKSTSCGADPLTGGFGVDPLPPTSSLSSGQSLCSSVLGDDSTRVPCSFLKASAGDCSCCLSCLP